MPPRRQPSVHPAGYTLLEVILVLSLLAILLGAAVPRVQSLVDRMAVRGARETVIGHFTRARSLAVARGGAGVIVSEEPSRLLLVAPGLDTSAVDLFEERGAHLRIPGSAERVTFRFGPLGIGRMTSRTLEIRRGEAEAAIVISSYGRVRRR